MSTPENKGTIRIQANSLVNFVSDVIIQPPIQSVSELAEVHLEIHGPLKDQDLTANAHDLQKSTVGETTRIYIHRPTESFIVDVGRRLAELRTLRHNVPTEFIRDNN
jgi:hypothetical protein